MSLGDGLLASLFGEPWLGLPRPSILPWPGLANSSRAAHALAASSPTGDVGLAAETTKLPSYGHDGVAGGVEFKEEVPGGVECRDGVAGGVACPDGVAGGVACPYGVAGGVA